MVDVGRRTKLQMVLIWLDNPRAALDRWIGLDIVKRENAPQSPSEPFSEEYAYACKHIDAAAYELDRATDALRAFESNA